MKETIETKETLEMLENGNSQESGAYAAVASYSADYSDSTEWPGDAPLPPDFIEGDGTSEGDGGSGDDDYPDPDSPIPQPEEGEEEGTGSEEGEYTYPSNPDAVNSDTTTGAGGTTIDPPVIITVTSVTISPASAELYVGDTVQLCETVQPDLAVNKDVEWFSDNPGVASVEQDGVVTAHSQGTAVITVRTVDGGYEDCCYISVNKKIPKKVTVISCTPEGWISSSEIMGRDMATAFNSQESYVVNTPTNASQFETCWNEAGECIIVHTHGNPNGLYDHGEDSTPLIVSKANIANLSQNDEIHFIMVTACETAGGDESDNVACWLSKKINPNGIVIANKYIVSGSSESFEASGGQDGWRVYRNGALEHMPKELTMSKAYEIFKIFQD